MRIEKMINSILSKPQLCVCTSISNDIVDAVYRENCVELLIPLLLSKNDEILHASIWIVSELGQQSYPLLPYIVELLTHDDPYIRYYALDSILASAQRICSVSNDLHETIIQKVCSCLNDFDENVRNKACHIQRLFTDMKMAT